MEKIYFITEAKKTVGFGHVNRCLSVGQKLKDKFEILFSGNFSSDAQKIIKKSFKIIDFKLISSNNSAAIIDIMFDQNDMDYYDMERIYHICKKFRKTVLISSSKKIPKILPVDVVIGHLLEDYQSNPYRFKLYAGLQYSPVDENFVAYRLSERIISEEINHIFVCFGSWNTVDGPLLVLDSLKMMKFKGKVDVLISPLQSKDKNKLKSYTSEFRLKLHNNIPSIAPLFYDADLAIGTYGHVVFEALCLGIPYIVIGVKDFQVSYSKLLENMELLACAGKLNDVNIKDISNVIAQMDKKKRSRLSLEGRKHIDPYGIQRIVNIIKREIISY
jgi:spore coat polysaccharide biosynthesis predicted glycosyltransferase SpsG